MHFSLYIRNCKLVLSASTLFFCFCKIQKWPIDVALSGSEAVVESHYSDMKTKSMVGGQSNDILVQRANVDWSFQKTLAVPGNNQRRGNPLFTRRQRCGTAPPSASSIHSSKKPCLEQVCSWKQSS